MRPLKKRKKVQGIPSHTDRPTKRKLKKKKKRKKVAEEPPGEKDYSHLFKKVSRPEKSIVLRCLEAADKDGNYPPRQPTYWGNRTEDQEFEDVWELWKGHLSFIGEIRKDALRELMVGLAESQIWEIYTFIRDLGTRTQRTRSVHAMRIEGALRAKRNPLNKTKKKQKKIRKGD